VLLKRPPRAECHYQCEESYRWLHSLIATDEWYMCDCTTVRQHDHACSECSLLQVFTCALVMSRLGSGPCLVGRIGSGVRVSDSFHIFSSAVVRTSFKDTPASNWNMSHVEVNTLWPSCHVSRDCWWSQFCPPLHYTNITSNELQKASWRFAVAVWTTIPVWIFLQHLKLIAKCCKF